MKQLPYYYTDKEEDENFERTLELGTGIQNQFMDIIILLVQRLHSDGILKRKFGKAIPVIIQELEYYDKPVNWTRKVNPTGLTEEFENWVNSMGE